MKTATLTITVEYPDEVDSPIIDSLLREVAEKGAADGHLTGDGEVHLFSWDYDVKISGSDTEPGRGEGPDTGPRVIAHFQPQAWINDEAVNIDGAFEFDVTKQIKQMGREAALEIRDGDYSSDDLYLVYCVQNPEHEQITGPSIVTVEESIRKFFEKD